MVAIGSVVAASLLGALGWAVGPKLMPLFRRAGDEASETSEGGWPAPQLPADLSGTTPSTATMPAVSTGGPGPRQAPPTLAVAVDGDVEGTPNMVAPAEPTETTGEPGIVERPFGKARGFRDALRGAGMSPAEADAIVVALTDHVDFRRCRPEHLLRINRGPDGVLQYLEYQVGRTEVYRASRSVDGFTGERVTIEVEIRRRSKGGGIAGSLGQALVHNGLGRSLVGAFVEVFERSISFTRDTRAGDSFRILVDEQFVDGESLGYGTVHAVEYAGGRMGRKRGFWFEPTKGKGDFYDAQGRAANGGWLRTPLRYDHISSPFDMRRRHPVLKRIVPHQGVDYAASSGTPIWAAADGVVSFAGYKGANGNLISLRHGNGYETFYAHLSRISRGIKRGVTVKQRQLIGAVGTTGRSTGPHLHFALKRNGRFIDPMTQLNGPGKPLPQRHMARFKAHRKRLEQELEAIALAPAPDADADAPDPGRSGAGVFHEEGAL